MHCLGGSNVVRGQGVICRKIVWLCCMLFLVVASVPPGILSFGLRIRKRGYVRDRSRRRADLELTS